MAICAYCHEDRKLCLSHAIPDGIFRSILRRSKGQLITIPGGEGKIKKSQDTGKAKLLCRECEDDFNRRFDAALVNTLKSWDKNIVDNGLSIRHTFDPSHLAQGLASIFWRACASGSSMYSGAKVSALHETQLLTIVQGEREDVLKNCSVLVHRIYDKKHVGDVGFSQSVISNIVLPVNAYSISWGRQKKFSHFSFAVIMQGFLFSMMLPKLPAGKLDAPGYLNRKRDQLFALPMNFLDYAPLIDVMVIGMDKHNRGLTTLSDK